MGVLLHTPFADDGENSISYSREWATLCYFYALNADHTESIARILAEPVIEFILIR